MRQRRRFLVRAMSVVVLAVGGGTVAYRASSSCHPELGGISCAEVQARAADYFAGKLDSGLRERISIHLEECPRCRPLKEKMAGKMLGQRVDIHTDHVHEEGVCQCEGCSNRHWIAHLNPLRIALLSVMRDW